MTIASRIDCHRPVAARQRQAVGQGVRIGAGLRSERTCGQHHIDRVTRRVVITWPVRRLPAGVTGVTLGPAQHRHAHRYNDCGRLPAAVTQEEEPSAAWMPRIAKLPPTRGLPERRRGERRAQILRALLYGSFRPRRRAPRRADERSVTAVDWHHPQWLAISMLIVICSCADAFLTLVAGRARHRHEVNPLMAPLVGGLVAGLRAGEDGAHRCRGDPADAAGAHPGIRPHSGGGVAVPGAGASTAPSSSTRFKLLDAAVSQGFRAAFSRSGRLFALNCWPAGGFPLTMLEPTPLYGGNADFLDALYEQYLRDPASVAARVAQLFRRAWVCRRAAERAHGPVRAGIARARRRRGAAGPAAATGGRCAPGGRSRA